MKRVYLALPTADAVAIAIRKRLKRKKCARRLEVVNELESAQVVVTSTADIVTLPEVLPESVELLQLIDCGGGLRYRDAPGLTINNASSFYASQVAALAWSIVHERSRMRQAFGSELLQLGLIGLGNVGLMSLIRQQFDPFSIERPFPFRLDRFVVNDIRTRYRDIVDRWREFDSWREHGQATHVGPFWMPLDQLLSTSDVVVVAVHRGPTADPLLGERETRLLDPRAWLVDVSEEGVVDPTAFAKQLVVDFATGGEDDIDPTESGASDQLLNGPVYMRVSGDILERTPKEVAKFVGWNLRQCARGRTTYNRVRHVADGNSRGECGC